jgi:hypothetical protein
MKDGSIEREIAEGLAEEIDRWGVETPRGG